MLLTGFVHHPTPKNTFRPVVPTLQPILRWFTVQGPEAGPAPSNQDPKNAYADVRTLAKNARIDWIRAPPAAVLGCESETSILC